MNLLIDIGILLLIVVFVIQGMRRGVVKSVLSLLSVIISAIFAGVLSSSISYYIYNNYISSNIYDSIYNSLLDSDEYTVVTAFFKDLPSGVVNLLSNNGISESTILSEINGTNANITQGILDIISPVLVSVINVFVAIIVFFLLLIFFRILINATCSFIKIPILSTVNTLVGGVAGFVFAICVSWLIIAVISFTGKFVVDGDVHIILDGINASFLANILSGLNPFSWIF